MPLFLKNSVIQAASALSYEGQVVRKKSSSSGFLSVRFQEEYEAACLGARNKISMKL